MPLFTYDAYPNVEAGCAREAARVFANLRAKSDYGAGGECTFLEANPRCLKTFEAFIGNFRGHGVTAARDVSITVEQQADLAGPKESRVL